jgi:hypothetical protein
VNHIWQFALQLKRLIIFGGSLAVIFIVYSVLLPDVWRRTNTLFALVVMWFFTAYIVLPRLHRFLSRFYVPDHFIGRIRTADGLLSDPINLGLNGHKNHLIKAMEAAGWQLADPLKPKTIWQTIISIIFRKSYPNAPVSDAFLFGRRQSLAFQKEVDNNPHQRHHVRFWRTPQNWFLPGGYKVDWLGAATYDLSVAFSFFTSQFTHKIDERVDRERDFLVRTLETIQAIKNVKKIEHFFPSYRSRNGFGHFFFTDGSMVMADIKKAPKS